ncbi:copine protein [Spatholobus suberectus]|nr:copine protein [Spatholobus suberectus]
MNLRSNSYSFIFLITIIKTFGSMVVFHYIPLPMWTCGNYIDGIYKTINVGQGNKECGISSSSHVVNIKDMHETLERGQGSTKNDFHRSASICKAFIQFCSTEIICPQEHRAALAVKLYGVQAALLSALGNPFEKLSQSTSSRNSSQMLSLGQASTGFLPAMLWTGMFIVSFVYTVLVVWSLAFRVPIISMLCLALLYCLSVLVASASGFDVMCGTVRMSGILFASLGVLGFVVLLLVLVMLVLFASWRGTKQDRGAK